MVYAGFARELECQLAESRRETERLAALVFEQAKELAESKRLHKEACAANETWERELSAVMPADYKDWWQNSKAEWPVVARLTIKNLRKHREEACAVADRLADTVERQAREIAGLKKAMDREVFQQFCKRWTPPSERR